MALLVVKLKPGASKDQVEGWTKDVDGRPVLSVKVMAPATEGKANKALIKLISAHLFVAPSSVRVVGGLQSRTKRLEIESLTAEELDKALSL